jgi:hypothetical protein
MIRDGREEKKGKGKTAETMNGRDKGKENGVQKRGRKRAGRGG